MVLNPSAAVMRIPLPKQDVVRNVESRSNNCRTKRRRSSAPTSAAWHGGTPIQNWCSAKRYTRSNAHTAERPSTATEIIGEFTAPVPATPKRGGVWMDELKKRIEAYQFTMSMVRELLSKGIITESEYRKIDTIIAEKYGLNSCTIFR